MHLAIDFSTWRPAPTVGAQPRVVLAHWRVFVGCERRRFLAGMLPRHKTLRVTSAIVDADSLTRTWRTRSGRVYETPGPPARDLALCALLASMVCTYESIDQLIDVSEAAWSDMQRAVQ